MPKTIPDLISIIIEDHRSVDNLYTKFQTTITSEDKLKTGYEIIRELSVHAACEEELLYPMVKKVIPNGENLASRSITEHQELKKVLYKLDQKTCVDPEYLSLMNEVMKDVVEHVKKEETEILPILKQHSNKQELIEMGEKFQSKKKSVPTRPHPSAPTTFPLNVPANKMTAPIDKARDTSRFSEERK